MQHARFKKEALLVPLAVSLLACAPAGETTPASTTPAVDTAAVLAGLSETWARWAVADTAEDVDAIVALATENARMDFKGMPPMVGREAARSTIGVAYKQLDYLEAAVSPATTVAISNELAHQTGTYRERYTMKGTAGEMTDYGRYAAALVKESDGQWRWAYMMGMVDSTTTKK